MQLLRRGSAQPRGKQVKIAWRSSLGLLDAFNPGRGGELSSGCCTPRNPAGVCTQTPCNSRGAGARDPSKLFFFFKKPSGGVGAAEGEAVSCFQRSSHLAAGTAMYPLVQHLQKCSLDFDLFLETSSAGGRSEGGGRGGWEG